MAIVDEIGLLFNVKPIDFKDKETQERKVGSSVLLLVPAQDPRYDGFGFRVVKLMELSQSAFERFPALQEQAAGLFLHKVRVQCDMQRRGNYTSLSPLSISSA